MASAATLAITQPANAQEQVIALDLPRLHGHV